MREQEKVETAWVKEVPGRHARQPLGVWGAVLRPLLSASPDQKVLQAKLVDVEAANRCRATIAHRVNKLGWRCHVRGAELYFERRS